MIFRKSSVVDRPPDRRIGEGGGAWVETVSGKPVSLGQRKSPVASDHVCAPTDFPAQPARLGLQGAVPASHRERERQFLRRSELVLPTRRTG